MDRSVPQQRPDPLRVAMVMLANPNKAAVLLSGPPGCGKSFVLRQLLNRLSRSGDLSNPAVGPVLLRPTTGTTDLGLEAFMPGPGTYSAGSGSESTDGPPRLVAIDDVDLLDRSSLSLLSQCLDRRQMRLAATVQVSLVPRVLKDLRPVLPLGVVSVEPWQREQAAAFVEHRLGGVLHELTVQRLLDVSGGNALCLTETIDWGVSTDRLRREHEVWAWRGPIVVPPLTQARIAGELELLADDVQDVLATVALNGGAELSVLEARFGAAQVEHADAAGVLRISRSGNRLMVGLSYPLYGQVLLQGLALTRRRRLAAGLGASVRATGVRREGDAYAIARMSHSALLPVPAPLVVQAAEQALRRHQPALAQGLLERHAPDEPLSRSLLASALTGQGRLAEAAAVLVRSPEAAAQESSDEDVRRAALLLIGTGDREAWSQWSAAHENRDDRTADSYWALVSAWTGEQLLATVSAATPVIEEGRWTQVAARRALIAVVAALAQAGKVDAALRTGLAAARQWLDEIAPVEKVNLLALIGFCYLLAGAVSEADRLAGELCQLGGTGDWAYAYSLGALLAGVCASASTRVRHAGLRLSESAVSQTGSPADVLRPYSLAQLSLAAAMAGRPQDTGESLLRGARGPARTPCAFTDLTELARAETLLVRGMQRAAYNAGLDVADRSEAAGQVSVALLALHLCARAQPSTPVARRLVRLAGVADFPLSGVYARHATALAAGDGDAVSDVASEFRRSGLNWLAAEAAAHSLGLSHPAPSRRQELESHRILAGLGEAVAPPWWPSGNRVSPLTQREREVAELAATGWSSPRIAAHLQVSMRTVENHLQHAYRKLDISRRQDLPAALRTV